MSDVMCVWQNMIDMVFLTTCVCVCGGGGVQAVQQPFVYHAGGSTVLVRGVRHALCNGTTAKVAPRTVQQ